ncbi:MAG: WYL domain-containing protein [Clostridia bacterium]|nr:WYL domain-containing protein [Clostridia bacterium]
MIFSELYSAYYNTIAAIITEILERETSEKALQKIIAERAFGESALTILPTLKSEKWQLVHPDMTTPLGHIPTMPLTFLQKQWLKAVSLDPRVKLFGVEFPDLDDVPPLFTPDDYYVYDKYSDGDPFEDEEYIRQFRIILDAIRRQTQIKFEMVNRKGATMFVRCRPVRLEYSEKDDKFRMITAGWRTVSTVNLAKIQSCAHYSGDKQVSGEEKSVQHKTITVKLIDERNALERFMLHFAHFEKQAEKLDRKTYLVKIRYVQDDETEMVIRILSFGPMAEVLEPESFRKLIIEKLKKQKNCGLK